MLLFEIPAQCTFPSPPVQKTLPSHPPHYPNALWWCSGKSYFCFQFYCSLPGSDRFISYFLRMLRYIPFNRNLKFKEIHLFFCKPLSPANRYPSWSSSRDEVISGTITFLFRSQAAILAAILFLSKNHYCPSWITLKSPILLPPPFLNISWLKNSTWNLLSNINI